LLQLSFPIKALVRSNMDERMAHATEAAYAHLIQAGGEK
jgi:hypothetical protein